jgi:uncharacterized protein YqgV (UPF0045/DUF77 family)
LAPNNSEQADCDEIVEAFRRVHEMARKHCGRVLMVLAVDDRAGAQA